MCVNSLLPDSLIKKQENNDIDNLYDRNKDFSLLNDWFGLQNAAAKEVEAAQKKELAILKDLDLTQYEIKGSEQDWKQALSSGSKMISIKGYA